MASFTARIDRLKAEVIALFLIVGGIGTATALITPIGWGHDESVHAFKADSISRGHFFSQKIGPWQSPSGADINVYGSYTAVSLHQLQAVAATAKTTFTGDAHCISQLSLTQCSESTAALQQIHDASAASLQGDVVLTDFWGVNASLPVGYLPSALGFGIARLANASAGTGVLTARVANALAAAALCSLAFYFVRRTRFRWLVFAVAAAPFATVSFSSLGPDGLLVALSILLAAGYYRVVAMNKKDTITMLITAITAVAIPLIKLPYVLLSLPLLLLPIYDKIRHPLIVRFLIALALIAPGLMWNYFARDATRTQYLVVNTGPADPNSSAQLAHMLHHPIDTLQLFVYSFATETIGSFGHVLQISFSSLPAAAVLTSCILIVIASLYACVGATPKRQRALRLLALACLAAIIGVIAGIMVMMYLSYNAVGATTLGGVQGRYIFPLVALGSLVLATGLRVIIRPVHSFEKYTYLAIVCAVAASGPLWVLTVVY